MLNCVLLPSFTSVASMPFQDSQNVTFLQQDGVYLLVPRDLWLEILCFLYGIFFNLPLLSAFFIENVYLLLCYVSGYFCR